MSRTERRATTIEGRLAETAARVDRRARESVRGRPEATPALDEARAEFGAARPPLVVETLEQRLRRCLPGARAEFIPGMYQQWSVWRGRTLLGHGRTEREAIDRAVALRGAR